MQVTGINRREFVVASAAAALALPAGIARAAAPLDQLKDIAARELERAGARVWLKDRVALADFSLPSSVPRLFLVDMAGGAVQPYLVTHGKGSDPEHIGVLQSFSNVTGSAATSRGAYITTKWYDGTHGPSMRLIGLDADNSNAEDRAIVIHGAAYANPDMITRWGKLGRSDGCFAFPEANLMEILARMSPGRLLFADKF
jgi:hypothetical protein